jgi:hypothetical protein
MKVFTLPAVALLALPLPAQAPDDNLGNRPGPMDKVLLKDYNPQSSLKVPVTSVPKARYPVIDVHAHSYASNPQEVAEWVKVMDEVGIETTVILTGATGERFDRLVELYLKPYPKRFQLWCGIDTSNKEAPDYAERAVQELMRCYAKGARGVGEITDKGSGLGRNTGFGAARTPEPRDKRLHHDDPRLDAFWRKCAELKIPVNIHIADHPSAWTPPDARQERTPRYQRFNQYGDDVLSYDELLVHRDKLLDKHPKTTFIFCHFSNQGNDLATLSKVLDRFPNLYLDIAARGYEIGRQPKFAAKFLTRYQDRLVFGTDMGRTKDMYLHWWRLLETGDEYIEGPVWWRLYGLELPAPVLEKLYRSNARKLLNWQ